MTESSAQGALIVDGPGGAGEISRWWSEERAQPPEFPRCMVSAPAGREKRPILGCSASSGFGSRQGCRALLAPLRGAWCLCCEDRGFHSLRSVHPRLLSSVPPGRFLPAPERSLLLIDFPRKLRFTPMEFQPVPLPAPHPRGAATLDCGSPAAAFGSGSPAAGRGAATALAAPKSGFAISRGTSAAGAAKVRPAGLASGRRQQGCRSPRRLRRFAPEAAFPNRIPASLPAS